MIYVIFNEPKNVTDALLGFYSLCQCDHSQWNDPEQCIRDLYLQIYFPKNGLPINFLKSFFPHLDRKYLFNICLLVVLDNIQQFDRNLLLYKTNLPERDLPYKSYQNCRNACAMQTLTTMFARLLTNNH